MDFDSVFAVFEGVGHAAGGPGEFTLFADGDEAGLEAIGDGSGEDEAPGVDADDLVDFRVAGEFAEEIDGEGEEFWIAENRGDVLEKDAGFGEVGDITDGGRELAGVRHGDVIAGWREISTLELGFLRGWGDQVTLA